MKRTVLVAVVDLLVTGRGDFSPTSKEPTPALTVLQGHRDIVTSGKRLWHEVVLRAPEVQEGPFLFDARDEGGALKVSRDQSALDHGDLDRGDTWLQVPPLGNDVSQATRLLGKCAVLLQLAAPLWRDGTSTVMASSICNNPPIMQAWGSPLDFARRLGPQPQPLVSPMTCLWLPDHPNHLRALLVHVAHEQPSAASRPRDHQRHHLVPGAPSPEPPKDATGSAGGALNRVIMGARSLFGWPPPLWLPPPATRDNNFRAAWVDTYRSLGRGALPALMDQGHPSAVFQDAGLLVAEGLLTPEKVLRTLAPSDWPRFHDMQAKDTDWTAPPGHAIVQGLDHYKQAGGTP